MRFGKGLQPTIAAVLYSWLLRAPGSPVRALAVLFALYQ
jgi:hypothetical protein